MAAILKVKDDSGNWIDIPALKQDNYDLLWISRRFTYISHHTIYIRNHCQCHRYSL